MNTELCNKVEAAIWQRSGKREGSEIRFLCFLHDDQKPSARYNPEKATWYCDVCKKGGGYKDAAEKLGISTNGHKPDIRFNLEETYHYEIEPGVEHFAIDRMVSNIRDNDGKVEKKFSIKHLVDGQYIYKKDNLQIIPYHLPDIRAAKAAGIPIRDHEGERKANICIKLGLPATSMPFGANAKIEDSYIQELTGTEVYIYPDNDDPGENYALTKARALYGKAKVKIIHLPGLPTKGDIVDFVRSGGTKEQILKIEDETSYYEPENNLPEIAVQLLFNKAECHLTDAGNAERLIDKYGENLHYSYDRKSWLLWNGRYWDWVTDGRIFELALETIRSIYHQAADEPDKDRRRALLDHAKRSESEGRLSAMVSLAQTISRVSIKVDQLDTDLYLLNVKNGTIDLRTGILKPHNREDYLTTFIPQDYEPTAKSELWDNTLNTIFENAETIRDYVQRGIGYSATGCQDEQVVFFPYGPGGNGKSTLLGAIRNVLGPDYATEIEPSVFMVKTHETTGPNEGVARLYRKRLAISTEIEDGQKLSVSLIKRMTGGEKLHHEKKFEHAFEFTSTHKLWLCGNHKTIISDTTLSIWRRIKFINFNVTIPEEKRIKNLAELLKAPEHQKAILAWIIAGAVAWSTQGLGEPPEVTTATQAYRQEMDLLADFLNECCCVRGSETVTVAELYKKYKNWADENDTLVLGKNKFGLRLQEKGITKGSGTGNKTIWKGISLLK